MTKIMPDAQVATRNKLARLVSIVLLASVLIVVGLAWLSPGFVAAVKLVRYKIYYKLAVCPKETASYNGDYAEFAYPAVKGVRIIEHKSAASSGRGIEVVFPLPGFPEFDEIPNKRMAGDLYPPMPVPTPGATTHSIHMEEYSGTIQEAWGHNAKAAKKNANSNLPENILAKLDPENISLDMLPFLIPFDIQHLDQNSIQKKTLADGTEIIVFKCNRFMDKFGWRWVVMFVGPNGHLNEIYSDILSDTEGYRGSESPTIAGNLYEMFFVPKFRFAKADKLNECIFWHIVDSIKIKRGAKG